MPPLALYIHVPWCIRKCPYCDFNSHEAPDEIPEQRYLHQLLLDLEHDLAISGNRTIDTIFFGGGTPSLLSAHAIAMLLDGVAAHARLADDVEVTLEANPGSAEYAKFRDFRSAGINRLSIGVQSFNDQRLALLGRIHDADTASIAINAAATAGFERINIDLMHGLPGQTTARALQDLDRALDFDTGHVSWYQLTIEPNTAFWSNPPLIPVDDVLIDILDAGLELLDIKGYSQYEVSAFARDGQQCRHNINYWQFGDYIGIGAGAHGKLSHDDGRVVRTRKTRVPKDYMATAPEHLRFSQRVEPDELPLEFLMNALRLRDGVPSGLFKQRTGLALSTIQDEWQHLRDEGLMVDNDDRLQTTDTGYRFLDSVLSRFSQ